jgi:hypothetical protein
MRLKQHQIAALIRAVFATQDEEMTCDELLAVMATHVEGSDAASATDPRFARATAHLRLCANCRQERAVLAALLRMHG